jgi:hypothetical protein
MASIRYELMQRYPKYLVITDPPDHIFDIAELGLNDGRRVERIKQGEYRVQASDLLLRWDDPGAP